VQKAQNYWHVLKKRTSGSQANRVDQ